jgi:hypothetical protein
MPPAATLRRRDPIVEPLLEIEIHSFIWLGTIRITASGGQGALLKNRPLDPHKTFY